LTWHWRPAVLAASGAVRHAALDRLVPLGDLVALGTLTASAARFREAVVASGLEVLVPGGTQVGDPTIS
jgi:Flp pilus assembly CpaF family ATPase